MATEKKHAAWLVKDGKRHLYHGDDVEAATANGWERAEGVQGTGEPWNPPVEEGEAYHLDVVADVMRAANKARDAKAARKADREAKEAAANEKAAAEAAKNAPVKADFKVEVVEPRKK